MSLYKGNNLISGAMPNSANQSLSNLNSAGQDIIDGKVNKSGDTMTGSLMISGNYASTPHFATQCPKPVGENPNSTYNYGYWGVFDNVLNHLGGIAVMQKTSGVLTTILRSGLDNKQITVSSDGSTTCPASSAIHSIVTTEGISTTRNGYVKFGNGWIIQKGVVSLSSDQSAYTITLPTAFTNTNYAVCVTSTRAGSSGSGWDYVSSKTTTNFKICAMQGEVCWLAIGT